MAKPADLLIRDGNLPFIHSDATDLDRGDELGAIPASVGWQMRQTAERNGIRVVIMSASPLVPYSSLRLTHFADFSLRQINAPHSDLPALCQPNDRVGNEERFL